MNNIQVMSALGAIALSLAGHGCSSSDGGSTFTTGGASSSGSSSGSRSGSSSGSHSGSSSGSGSGSSSGSSSGSGSGNSGDGGSADGGVTDGGAADAGAFDGGDTDGVAGDGVAGDGGAVDGGAVDGGITDGALAICPGPATVSCYFAGSHYCFDYTGSNAQGMASCANGGTFAASPCSASNPGATVVYNCVVSSGPSEQVVHFYPPYTAGSAQTSCAGLSGTACQ